MELFLALIILVIGIFFFLRSQRVTDNVDVEELPVVTPTLPKGAGAPIVRPVQPSQIQNRQIQDDSDDFITSVLIGAATDNALMGGMAGGSFVGGMIGQTIADESHNNYQSQQDYATDDNSNDSSSSDDSSYDSDDSSSDDSSSGSDD